MILEPGHWVGRGSYRPIGETLGCGIDVDFQLREEEAGKLIEGRVESQDGTALDLTVWVVADEVGTYTVSVRGGGVDVDGTAKLEAEPHLGLLWSEDGGTHITFALFAARDAIGLRGFSRAGPAILTWEVAIYPRREVVIGDNVVAFDTRRSNPRS